MDGAEFNKTPSSPRDGVEEIDGLDEDLLERVSGSRQMYGARAYYMPEDIFALEQAGRTYLASQPSAPDAKKNK